MEAILGVDMGPVAPPPYHHARREVRLALHLDALTLVTRLHLLALCQIGVQLAHWRFPPPLSAGPGGRPRRYSEQRQAVQDLQIRRICGGACRSRRYDFRKQGCPEARILQAAGHLLDTWG